MQQLRRSVIAFVLSLTALCAVPVLVHAADSDSIADIGATPTPTATATATPAATATPDALPEAGASTAIVLVLLGVFAVSSLLYFALPSAKADHSA